MPSTILNTMLAALALLGTGVTALPHPDSPTAAPTPTATTDQVPPPATSSPKTTPPPTTSSLAPGEVPFTGSCDLEFCNSLGTSVCFYWGGITGWDSLHNPRPGETITYIGTCSYH